MSGMNNGTYSTTLTTLTEKSGVEATRHHPSLHSLGGGLYVVDNGADRPVFRRVSHLLYGGSRLKGKWE